MTRFEVDSIARLHAVLGEPMEGGALVLDPVTFAGWAFRLHDGGWVLTNGHEAIALGGHARMTIQVGSSPHLLVGENGHATLQAAIDRAQGGEIILVAPGTYEEGRECSGEESRADTYGLVINRPVTLQGVADDGTPIVDADDVAATVIATRESADGVSFLIAADHVAIRGLGFLPATTPDAEDCAGTVRKVFAVRGRAFTLRACVIEPKASHRVLSAVSFDGPETHAGSVISGNRIYGSITLSAGTELPVIASGSLVVSNNDIIGNVLPAVQVSVSASNAASLPALDDNTLFAAGDSEHSLVVQSDDGDADRAAPTQHSLNAYMLRLLRNHSGIGAAVFDSSGHVRTSMGAVPGSARSMRSVGIYRSIQAAIDAAENGDTVLISAGTYAESLVIENKSLTLRSAHGEAVAIAPPGADSTGLMIRGTFDAQGAPGLVVIHGLTFQGCAHGIQVAEGTKLDTLFVKDAQFTDIRNHAICVGGTAGSSSAALGKLFVHDTDFSRCGLDLREGGLLSLRRYAGNVDLVRSTFTGGAHADAAPPAAMEISGSESDTHWPLGHVRISGVLVTGHFTESILRIRHYSDVSRLAIKPDGDRPGLDLTDAVPGGGSALEIDATGFIASEHSLLYPRQADGQPAWVSGGPALGTRKGASDLSRPVWLCNRNGALKRTCENLHDALTLAEDGDTIVVAAGTYEEVLYISRDITLTGANRGISGSSHERGPETAIRGDIIIGPDAESVVIDGFAITGSITTALKARARQRFVLQNSVVDGRGARAAISLMKGASGTIADNVIMGGADEAIYVPYGFRDLVITTNCIRAATGSAAIVLGGGPGVDRVHVLGNTITGGDYGVFIEVSNGLAQPGDAIHIAGNTFGERDPCAGRPPVVACVYADDLVPAPLRASLGTSLALNSYLVSAPAVAQDVMFDEAPGDELSESGVMRVLCQGTGDSGETAANDRTDETEQPAFEPDQPRKMRAGSAE